MAELTIVIS